MPAENLWRVDIVNAVSDETDENGKKAIWHSINSQVRVDHNMSVIKDDENFQLNNNNVDKQKMCVYVFRCD